MPSPVRGWIGLVTLGIILILRGLFLLLCAKRLADRPYCGARSFRSDFYRKPAAEIRRSGRKNLLCGVSSVLLGIGLGWYAGFE